MPKSSGRKVWEAYNEHAPDSVKKHVNKAVKTVAHHTKTLRNRKLIEKRGRAWVEATKRSIRKGF